MGTLREVDAHCSVNYERFSKPRNCPTSILAGREILVGILPRDGDVEGGAEGDEGGRERLEGDGGGLLRREEVEDIRRADGRTLLELARAEVAVQ